VADGSQLLRFNLATASASRLLPANLPPIAAGAVALSDPAVDAAGAVIIGGPNPYRRTLSFKHPPPRALLIQRLRKAQDLPKGPRDGAEYACVQSLFDALIQLGTDAV